MPIDFSEGYTKAYSKFMISDREPINNNKNKKKNNKTQAIHLHLYRKFSKGVCDILGNFISLPPPKRQFFKIISIVTPSLFSIGIKHIDVLLNLCIPQRESKLIFISVHDVGTANNTACM